MLLVKLSNKFQSGNVLLLSLLMLAGGIAGALAVAVVVISELKQSSAADQGLVAFFDAESGLEQSIYDIRQTNLCDDPTKCKDDSNDYTNCDLPAVTASSCLVGTSGCLIPDCEKNIQPISRMEVNLEPNDTFQIDLDPSIDTEVSGFRFSNWSHAPGIYQLEAPLLEISYVVIGVDNLTSIYRPQGGRPYECTIAEGTDNCANSSIDNFGGEYPPGSVYQVRVKALRGQIFNLLISPLDDQGRDNTIRLSNYLDVKSKGQRGSVQQILRTTIPKNLPVYGFPDYVVFSEEPIVK